MKKGEKAKTWSATDIIELKSHYGKFPTVELAKRLQRSEYSIRRKASILGLKTKASVNEEFFETWSNDMAYALGYIWADGCLHKDGYRLCLRCHSADEEILLAIRRTMGSTHAVLKIPAKRRNNRNNGPNTSCSVASKKLVDSLKRHGLQAQKSFRDLPFPNNIPDVFLPHFVRGYFDGDGCINIRERNKHRQYTVSLVATKKFARGMQRAICLAIRLNKLPLKRKPGQKQFVIAWYKTQDIKDFCKWIYPEGEYISLNRKRKKLEAVLGDKNETRS